MAAPPRARASLVRLRVLCERPVLMNGKLYILCIGIAQPHSDSVENECSSPGEAKHETNKSPPPAVQMARMAHAMCGCVHVWSMSMSMSSMSAMLHVHARKINALFYFQAVRSGRLKSGPRRSSPFLAPLEEGLKSKGVSVRVAHAEAEQQEAGEHARHRPDGEHAQVVHADARHVERAEGARAVPRQPVARLVGVAELVEDVVPKRGDRGVLRV